MSQGPPAGRPLDKASRQKLQVSSSAMGNATSEQEVQSNTNSQRQQQRQKQQQQQQTQSETDWWQQQYEQQMKHRLHGLSQQLQVRVPYSGPSNHWTVRADAVSQRLDLLFDDVMKTRDELRVILKSAGKECNTLYATIANLQTQRDEAEKQLKVKTDKVATLERETEDLKSRLSAMASKKMKQDNPCVEDLSDPHRPTAIKDRWDAFFNTGQYWNTFSQLNTKGKSEDDIIVILYRVCQVVYTTSAVYLHRVEKRTTKHVTQDESPSENTPGQELSEAGRSDGAGVPLGRNPEELTQICMRNVQSAGLDVEHLTKFLHELVDICFHMQMHKIPLVLDFSSGPGSPFDGNLYRTEDDSKSPGQDAVIKLVMYPPLLRKAGGSVLSKGLATVREKTKEVTKKPETPSQTHPEETNRNSAKSIDDPESEGNPDSNTKIASGLTELAPTPDSLDDRTSQTGNAPAANTPDATQSAEQQTDPGQTGKPDSKTSGPIPDPADDRTSQTENSPAAKSLDATQSTEQQKDPGQTEEQDSERSGPTPDSPEGNAPQTENVPAASTSHATQNAEQHTDPGQTEERDRETSGPTPGSPDDKTPQKENAPAANTHDAIQSTEQPKDPGQTGEQERETSAPTPGSADDRTTQAQTTAAARTPDATQSTEQPNVSGQTGKQDRKTSSLTPDSADDRTTQTLNASAAKTPDATQVAEQHNDPGLTGKQDSEASSSTPDSSDNKTNQTKNASGTNTPNPTQIAEQDKDLGQTGKQGSGTSAQTPGTQ